MSAYLPCLGCREDTTRRVVLDFTDDVRRSLAICVVCSGAKPTMMKAVFAAFSRYGVMPLNPDAVPRECPMCGAADERKCGCL
jgi:hypothetical protein